MKEIFPTALAALLDPSREGGFSDNPADPGGATNHGVTQRTWEEFVGHPVPVSDIEALTTDEVAPLYKTRYWDTVRGDDLPAGLDYALFDFAVNSGVHEAAVKLQEIIGAMADGIIGDHTLYTLSQKHATEVIAALQDARLAMLESLPTWAEFGHGWATRVNAVRDEALALVQ